MRQWDIWQVLWRHEDGEKTDRPALVLSSDSEIAKGGVVWVAKFSGSKPLAGGQVIFSPHDPDWPALGLTKLCYLWLGSARQLDRDEFLYRRGGLSAFHGLRILKLVIGSTGLKIV